MAGELTHIIPTHPSDPNYRASKTKGIAWCDANGVAHTIIAVYWSPTNNVNDRKLIWQLSNDVPYDNTCTATITLSQDKTAWIVTVTKDGEDVTSSLQQITTWIYDGKGERVNPQRVYTNTIDLSQKPRGDYRVDLAQITSKAGGYFPGTGVISVPEHIYIGNLVAGSQNVAIEYVPTEDITVNSIEIFTSQTTSATSGRIKILHESGLYVGVIDGNNQDASTERYNLTGRPRTVSNVGVTLYAGKKYYIVFQNSSNDTYYPTYFQNETGNYKVYANTQTATQINIADLSVVGNFLGGICPNRHPTKDDKLYLLSLNINDSIEYLGYNNTEWNPALVGNHFYRRKSNTYNNVTNVSITSGDDHYKAAKLFGNIKKYNIILQNGELTNGSNYNGSIAQMATGYTSYVDVDANNEPIALTTLPSNPKDGLYYINASALPGGRSNYDYEVVVYENNNWTRGGQYYMDQNIIASYINYPDWWNKDFEDLNVNYTVADNFTSIALSTDKKFYLKINGKEV